MEYDAPYQLNVIMTHIQCSLAHLTHGGKSFREQIIEGFTVRKAFAEFWGQFRKLRVGQTLHLGFQFIDSLHERSDLFYIAFVFAADYLGENLTEHWRTAPDGYKFGNLTDRGLRVNLL
jgi:hypothetical protein